MYFGLQRHVKHVSLLSLPEVTCRRILLFHVHLPDNTSHATCTWGEHANPLSGQDSDLSKELQTPPAAACRAGISAEHSKLQDLRLHHTLLQLDMYNSKKIHDTINHMIVFGFKSESKRKHKSHYKFVYYLLPHILSYFPEMQHIYFYLAY